MARSIVVERFFALSDSGLRRDENQDAWRADAAAGLFLVADGMGGMRAGAAAATAVAEALPSALARRLEGAPTSARRGVPDAVRAAVAEVSAEVRRRAASDPRFKGMGSTVVLALVRGARAYVAHLGDSRAYLLEAQRLLRLTRDHSVVARMLELGQISAEEAAVHPLRHSLSRYVGMEGEASAVVREVPLKKNGRLLLCSDGLTNMVPEDAVSAALSAAKDPEAACRRLLEQANGAGGLDNATVLVANLRRGP